MPLLLGARRRYAEPSDRHLNCRLCSWPVGPQQTNNGAFPGSQSPPPGQEMQGDHDAGAMERQTISREVVPTDGLQQITSDSNVTKGFQGADGHCEEGHNGDRVTPRKWAGGMASCRETGEVRRRRTDAGKQNKAPSPCHVFTAIREDADPNLGYLGRCW
jgi:hypothetical protein